jgi:uncharacterized coiled-coil DUF342 family protein
MSWPVVSRRAYEKLCAERDSYKNLHEKLNSEIKRLRDDCEGHRSSYERINVEVGNLRSERDGYKSAYQTAADELGNLRAYGEPPPRPQEDVERMEGKPSIFLVCQPKAGTKYLGATLAQTLGYDYG